MQDQQLHPELKKLCDSLDSIAQAVLNITTDNRTIHEAFGWNCPAINRTGLSRIATDLAEAIRNRGSVVLDDPLLSVVKGASANIDRLKGQTIGQMWSGNAGAAVIVYLSTISSVKCDLDSILGWQSLRDTNLIPAKLARRLRSYESTLDEISPKRDELARRINLIKEGFFRNFPVFLNWSF